MSTPRTSDDPDPEPTHIAIEPSILYFGTAVALLSTENPNGTFNLAPMSSAWALERTIVLGLGADGQTARNLAERPDLVINMPAPDQWRSVERLGPLTGRNPVPATMREGSRFEPEKFQAAGLVPQPSHVVAPPRVADCPLQFEARAVAIHHDVSKRFVSVEALVLKVHADPTIIVPGTNYVDPGAWSPLIYNFRHYFALGAEVGHSSLTETPPIESRRPSGIPQSPTRHPEPTKPRHII